MMMNRKQSIVFLYNETVEKWEVEAHNLTEKEAPQAFASVVQTITSIEGKYIFSQTEVIPTSNPDVFEIVPAIEPRREYNGNN